MASILKNPTHRANLGYNGFDMENLLKFTSTTGELLPVYHDILQPGDKVSLKTIIKSKTKELTGPSMVNLTEHLEWFFVPLTQIYSIFGDFFYNIQDFKSSLFNLNLINSQNYKQLPHFSPVPRSSGDPTISDQLSDALSTNDLTFPTDGADDDFNGTCVRVMELLGIPMHVKWAPDATHNFTMALCPLLGCAYQKIFMDVYRDSERELNDPSVYNLDSFYDEPWNMATSGDLYKFYQLRYRPMKRDFFRNVYTSPLMGNRSLGSLGYSTASSSSSDLIDVNQWLADVQIHTNEPDGHESDGRNSAPTQVSLNSFTESEGVSVQGIRTAFAVSKCLEITRRAGKHYDKQTLAHFGVDVPSGIAGEVMRLGGSSSKIIIDELYATASTSQSELGQLGGRGFGRGESEEIKFEAPCHGILMCIYSCEPETDYFSVGYDRLNTLVNRADWFMPEYDNLGMQPLFSYQCRFGLNSAVNSSVVGWQYRYSELKCKYNRVAGDLMRSLSYWTAYDDFDSTPRDLRFFYVSPYSLDSIMLVPYKFDAASDWDNIFKYDPLVHELFFDVKKSSKMSTYGLENL